MPIPPLTIAERRSDAERLIGLARGLPNRPDEEMVVNYLDHAIYDCALFSVCVSMPRPPKAVSSHSIARGANRDLPKPGPARLVAR